jgi:hypothetical protein
MAGLACDSPTPEYLQVLRDHVRAPVEEARQHAQEERAELASEVDAFAQFGQHVDEATPRTPHGRQLPAGLQRGSNQLERLRNAYRETVLSLPHFDARYGESLAESVEMEFGPEVATVFTADGAAFTPIVKERLLRTVEESTTIRDRLVENIDEELESLARADTRLASVVDRVDRAQLPIRPNTELTTQLDSLVRMRQEHLCRSRVTEAADGHDLCDYLYAPEPWTYPVLVAVCRFREAAVR